MTLNNITIEQARYVVHIWAHRIERLSRLWIDRSMNIKYRLRAFRLSVRMSERIVWLSGVVRAGRSVINMADAPREIPGSKSGSVRLILALICVRTNIILNEKK